MHGGASGRLRYKLLFLRALWILVAPGQGHNASAQPYSPAEIRGARFFSLEVYIPGFHFFIFPFSMFP